MEIEINQASSIEIKVVESPLDLLEYVDEVDEIWEGVQQERGLENLRILSLLQIDDSDDKLMITAFFVEYKYFYIQKLKSEINLDIFPVGVSGVVIIEEGDERSTVLARRREGLTQYPLHYELVPSGGIDESSLRPDGEVDYRGMLARELTEEVDIGEDSIKSIHTLGLVFDRHDGVYDICCALELKSSFKEVLDGLERSDEYFDSKFVPIKELKRFVEGEEMIVPTSVGIMELIKENGY